MARNLVLIAVIVLILGGLFLVLRPDNSSGVPRDRTFDVSIEGDGVTLLVSSDEPMELHLHGYDVEQEVEPAEKARLHFEADITGRFEIEDHESESELGVLQVRPR